MHLIKIRFNTDCTDGVLLWRVLIDGAEHLASHVTINVPTCTTTDHIQGIGIKHHISCETDKLLWENNKLVIG